MGVSERCYHRSMVAAQGLFVRGEGVKAGRALRRALRTAEGPAKAYAEHPFDPYCVKMRERWEQRRAWAESCLAFVEGQEEALGDLGLEHLSNIVLKGTPYEGLSYNPDGRERWENGVPHDPRSEEIVASLEGAKRFYVADLYDWRSTGDGGESLMYSLDCYFFEKDHGYRGNIAFEAELLGEVQMYISYCLAERGELSASLGPLLIEENHCTLNIEGNSPGTHSLVPILEKEVEEKFFEGTPYTLSITTECVC